MERDIEHDFKLHIGTWEKKRRLQLKSTRKAVMYPYIARENFYLLFFAAICNLFFFSLLQDSIQVIAAFYNEYSSFFFIIALSIFIFHEWNFVYGNYLKDGKKFCIYSSSTVSAWIFIDRLSFFYYFFLWGKNVKFKFLALNLFNIKIVYIYLPLVSCLSYLPLPMPRIPMLLTVFNVHSITFCCCSFFPFAFCKFKKKIIFFFIYFICRIHLVYTFSFFLTSSLIPFIGSCMWFLHSK